MPRDVSGNYTLPAGNPVVTATVISSTWANTTLNDIRDTLTDSLSRSGEGGMTAPLTIIDGTALVPSYTFSSETTLGLYRAAAGVLGSSGALRALAGTMAAPSIHFANAPASGFYSDGSGVGANLYSVINGEKILTVSSSGLTIENPGAAASGTFTFLDLVGDFNTFSIIRSTGQTFRITGDSIYTTLGTVNAVPLRIVTTNIERARFDTGGSLLVGHTSSSLTGRVAAVAMPGFNPVSGADNWKLAALQGREALGGGLSLVDNSGNGHAMWSDSGILVIRQGLNGGTASVNGVALASGATAWASASDIRLKTILEPIQGAVAKLSSLRTVIGRYKTDPEDARRPFLVAQDVQSVLPEAVDVIDAEGHLGLRYTELIPLIIAAINELHAQS